MVKREKGEISKKRNTIRKKNLVKKRKTIKKRNGKKGGERSQKSNKKSINEIYGGGSDSDEPDSESEIDNEGFLEQYSEQDNILNRVLKDKQKSNTEVVNGILNNATPELKELATTNLNNANKPNKPESSKYNASEIAQPLQKTYNKQKLERKWNQSQRLPPIQTQTQPTENITDNKKRNTKKKYNLLSTITLPNVINNESVNISQDDAIIPYVNTIQTNKTEEKNTTDGITPEANAELENNSVLATEPEDLNISQEGTIVPYVNPTAIQTIPEPKQEPIISATDQDCILNKKMPTFDANLQKIQKCEGTAEDITKIYKKTIPIAHPDKNPKCTDIANSTFQELNSAKVECLAKKKTNTEEQNTTTNNITPETKNEKPSANVIIPTDAEQSQDPSQIPSENDKIIVQNYYDFYKYLENMTNNIILKNKKGTGTELNDEEKSIYNNLMLLYSVFNDNKTLERLGLKDMLNYDFSERLGLKDMLNYDFSSMNETEIIPKLKPESQEKLKEYGIQFGGGNDINATIIENIRKNLLEKTENGKVVKMDTQNITTSLLGVLPATTSNVQVSDTPTTTPLPTNVATDTQTNLIDAILGHSKNLITNALSSVVKNGQSSSNSQVEKTINSSSLSNTTNNQSSITKTNLSQNLDVPKTKSSDNTNKLLQTIIDNSKKIIVEKLQKASPPADSSQATSSVSSNLHNTNQKEEKASQTNGTIASPPVRNQVKAPQPNGTIASPPVRNQVKDQSTSEAIIPTEATPIESSAELIPPTLTGIVKLHKPKIYPSNEPENIISKTESHLNEKGDPSFVIQ